MRNWEIFVSLRIGIGFLNQLGLAPLQIDLADKLEKAINLRDGGESESHRRFKEFAARNP